MRTIGMLDLKAEYALFRHEIRAAVDQVLESQQFIGGPAVGELEAAICQRLGAASAIAISNGTDALLCALMALGIRPGDEVIVPAFTFFATAGVVSRLGARPVFVDIDPRTFNIDPTLMERAITPRTKAIMPVHLFGQCAEMEALSAVARRHNLPIVEDAAQAIGAKYRGRAAGTLGTLGCFSFYPTKNLGGFGEGGLITTNDAKLGELVRQLRHHGESRRYIHERVGGNFRLDTMKCAILLIKLRRLDEFTAARRHSAARYNELLAGTPVQTPFTADGNEHVYHQYSILCDRRDELAAFLRDRGIFTGIYYPLGLHRQPCFADLARGVRLPVTESVCNRVLSLPCNPMLTDDDVNQVARSVQDFYGS